MTDDHKKIASDSIRLAIEPLQIILNEATDYMIEGKYRAALGTLIMFEEAAQDVSAALRVYRAVIRRDNP